MFIRRTDRTDLLASSCLVWLEPSLNRRDQRYDVLLEPMLARNLFVTSFAVLCQILANPLDVGGIPAEPDVVRIPICAWRKLGRHVTIPQDLYARPNSHV